MAGKGITATYLQLSNYKYADSSDCGKNIGAPLSAPVFESAICVTGFGSTQSHSARVSPLFQPVTVFDIRVDELIARGFALK